jgi:hypothetical protein
MAAETVPYLAFGLVGAVRAALLTAGLGVTEALLLYLIGPLRIPPPARTPPSVREE